MQINYADMSKIKKVVVDKKHPADNSAIKDFIKANEINEELIRK